MKQRLKQQIDEWKEELMQIKCALIESGVKPGSFAHNIASAEALRLSMCITDATELLVDYSDV